MALLSDLEIRWDDLMTASAVQVCWNGQAEAISDHSKTMHVWKFLFHTLMQQRGVNPNCHNP